jgi:hypothetical protein
MKTLLTTVLSFTAFSVSAAVYNSNGMVQNIQAIHNANIAPGKSFRFTGMTFVPGATRTYPRNLEGAFHLGYQGSTPSMNNRIDHAISLSSIRVKLSGWEDGLMECRTIT